MTEALISVVRRSVLTGLAISAFAVCASAAAAVSDGDTGRFAGGHELDLRTSPVAARSRRHGWQSRDVGGSIDGKPIRLLFEDHANSVSALRPWRRTGCSTRGGCHRRRCRIAARAGRVGSQSQQGAVIFYNGVMTTEITGKKCAPTGIHWMYDGHAFNTVIGRELTRAGHRRWYFLTVNNAFGLNVEASLAEIVRTNGGEVIRTIRHPIGSEDLFSELREASQAGAQVIALVNAGQDMIRAVREDDLLAVSKGKRCSQPRDRTQRRTHVIRPQLAQGLRLSHSFYWNMDAESRAWSMRFYQRTGAMPSDLRPGSIHR